MSLIRVESILSEAYRLSQAHITDAMAVSKLKVIIQNYKDLGYSSVEITSALQQRVIMDDISNSETLKANARLDTIINQALGR